MEFWLNFKIQSKLSLFSLILNVWFVFLYKNSDRFSIFSSRFFCFFEKKKNAKQQNQWIQDWLNEESFVICTKRVDIKLSMIFLSMLNLGISSDWYVRKVRQCLNDSLSLRKKSHFTLKSKFESSSEMIFKKQLDYTSSFHCVVSCSDSFFFTICLIIMSEFCAKN